MEFRWVIFIALWTILSGPIFGGSSGGKPSRAGSKAAAAKIVPVKRPALH